MLRRRTILGVVLCVSLIALTLRARRTAWIDGFGFERLADRAGGRVVAGRYYAMLDRGRLLLVSDEVVLTVARPDRGRGWRRLDPLSFGHWPADAQPAAQVGGLGIRYERGVPKVDGEWRRLVLPQWLLIALPSLVLLAPLYRAGRAWRRRRKGHCMACGYDLRASAERCPECGWTPMAKRRRRCGPIVVAASFVAIAMAVAAYPKSSRPPVPDATVQRVPIAPYFPKRFSDRPDIELVRVPGGKFRTYADPTQVVRVRPFFIGRTEVRWDQLGPVVNLDDLPEDERHRIRSTEKRATSEDEEWARVRTFAMWSDPMLGDQRKGLPAMNVSPQGARMFCDWLTAKTGRRFRLPTEAEWEWAARCGGMFDQWTERSGWQMQPVAMREANPWGLHDMLGNAAEWCTDVDGRFILRGGSYRIVHEYQGGRWVPEGERLYPSLRLRLDYRAYLQERPWDDGWLIDSGYVGFRVVCEE